MSSSNERSLKRKRRTATTKDNDKVLPPPPTPPGLCGDDDSDGEIICLGVFPTEGAKKDKKTDGKFSICPESLNHKVDSNGANEEQEECMILEVSKKNPVVENYNPAEITGDDDCMVVGSGPELQTNSTTRVKPFKCKSCSAGFVTQSGLNMHAASSHKTDVSIAEQFCSQDFGLPVGDVITYVCRTCCVCFEDSKRYSEHIQAHLSLSPFFQCNFCSGTQVCAKDLERHHERHMSKILPEPFKYMCVHCEKPTSFLKESSFIYHLATTHNAPIYVFCKSCGAGSCQGSTIIKHVKEGKCKRQMMPSTMNIGFTIATDLKLEPRDEKLHLATLNAFPNNFLTLSPCTHRTFIRFGNVFTSCPDETTSGKCFGIVNSHRWQTIMAAKESNGICDDSILNRYRNNENKDADALDYLTYLMNNPVPSKPIPPRLSAAHRKLAGVKNNQINTDKMIQCFFCKKRLPIVSCALASMINTQRLCHQIAYLPDFKTSNTSPTVFSNLMKKLKVAGYQASDDQPVVPFCKEHFDKSMVGNDSVVTSMAILKVDNNENLRAFVS